MYNKIKIECETIPAKVKFVSTECQCQYEPDLSSLPRNAYELRFQKLWLKDLDPLLCGRAGSITIDGVPYCRIHAGMKLVDMYVGAEE